MLGLFVTLAVSVGAVGIGTFLIQRWTADMDPAAQFGLWGLVGLGSLGLLTLPIGLLPQGLHWGIWIVAALAAGGGYKLYLTLRPAWPTVGVPKGLELLLPVGIGAAMILATIGVLAPSDSLDWDTLAYHLAVPKLWLQTGSIHYISYIHHSNFPWTVDDLYIWGIQWGDQYGAKAFSLAYLAFGLLAIFGITRQRYGERAGWWAALAFSTIPAVIWISGTAYIDVSNGIYAGLGVLFGAWFIEQPTERRYGWLAAVCLGFAAGSKYTGLQTILAVCAALILFGARVAAGRSVRDAVLIGLAAFAIACPWYAKTFVYTGNPVFPFFYSVFGGKNWADFNARIYNDEQKSFGVGTVPKANVAEIGHAVLGLAYQPGRYINPDQTNGGGFPFGALGVVGLVGGLAWCFSGKTKRFEAATLATVGLGLLMWFFLSQQSRYIIAQLVPLSVLAGAAIVRLKAGPILAAVAAVQAVYSLYLINETLTSAKIQVVTGKVSPSEYQSARIPFYDAAQIINAGGKEGRVALYDEVFGYLLDVPYLWANPGHTTELGYDAMRDGKDLVASYRRNGIDRVYLNLGIYASSDADFVRWLSAMGLMGTKAAPYEGPQRESLVSDPQRKWKVLIADAVATGDLSVVQTFTRGRRPTGLLLRVGGHSG